MLYLNLSKAISLNTASLPLANVFYPAVHGAISYGQKKQTASVAVLPASVRFPSHWPLTPSVTSVTSDANDRSDNEMIPGAVHRSPDINLSAEENLN